MTDTHTDSTRQTDHISNIARPESLLGRSLTTGHMRDRAEMVTILDRIAEDQVSSAATERHRSKGKLTAWERVERLFDADTFQEFGALRRHRITGMGMDNNRPFRDGVITGWGLIHGRTAFCYALDSRVLGGSLGETQAAKIHRCLDMALSAGAPIIAIHDGAGARVQEGGLALAGFGGIFRRHVAASGVVPQLSLIMGACAGGSAYAPALTDMIFMVRGLSQMVITGPDVIATVTGDRPDLEFLGGAEAHGTRSGVASFVHEDEESCLEEVRWLLQLLPSSVNELPPEYSTDDPSGRPCERLLDIVPAEDRVAYDVREVITELVDEGEFLEVQEGFARNVVCAMARIGGKSIGIVANQPLVLAGAMDIDSSSKAARFVGFCDAFHLPIVSLVDVPGFLPGVDQEHGGIIRHGAKLIFAYCRSTVPRIQVIMRKAFGGAYIVMDSLSIGADLSVAWPTHTIGVMGAEGAVDLIYRRDIAAAPDPALRRMELIDMYEKQVMQPMTSAELGLVDRIINPVHTREVIADALRTFQHKRHPANVVVHGVHPT
jgi:acetyl-CoA carboxylase carboxyltransferase component